MKLFIIVLVGILLVESSVGFVDVHIGKKRSEPDLKKLIDVHIGKKRSEPDLKKLIDVVIGKRRDDPLEEQLKDPNFAAELEKAIFLAKDLKPKIKDLVNKEKAKYGIA